MISPQKVYETLKSINVDFYAGVPDSLLKDFCAYITEHNKDNHIIASNEGAAIGLAIGHHLGTGKTPVVYMQNSGLGNIVNPVLSMVDKDVYGIPMVLVIGWRGEMKSDGTQLKDEPQHIKQGRITADLLDTMEIPYVVIDADTADIVRVLKDTVAQAQKDLCPVAILVRKGTFEKYILASEPNGYSMSRESAISTFVDSLTSKDIVIGTTGMPSRELFEVRKEKGQPNNDFLCVGGMGHASSIAVGVAQADTDKTVWCLDGDGALIMHMGALCINKDYDLNHFMVNNGAHDSVGGQPTVAFDVDIVAIAIGSGYKWAKCVDNDVDLQKALVEIKAAPKPALLEVRVSKGNRPELGRPTLTPKQTKRIFMDTIKK